MHVIDEKTNLFNCYKMKQGFDNKTKNIGQVRCYFHNGVRYRDRTDGLQGHNLAL